MIAILLATYNSELYIKEQLDSILNQTFTDWKLYIHDDGSKDKTIDIINSYINEYPNKFSFIKNRTIGLRSCKSFIALQEEVDADYYMFCDHDDVWLPNKIEISYLTMVESEKRYLGCPVVVHTDMVVVDSKLNTIHSSFWNYMGLLPDHCTFIELAALHCVNGCTIMFNKTANNVALKYKDHALMHDVLLSESVAAYGGVIIPIYEQTVLYRQHANNVLGAKTMDKSIISKLNKGKQVIYSNYELWAHANKIKRINILYFLLTKVYLFIIRIIRY